MCTIRILNCSNIFLLILYVWLNFGLIHINCRSWYVGTEEQMIYYHSFIQIYITSV